MRVILNHHALQGYALLGPHPGHGRQEPIGCDRQYSHHLPRGGPGHLHACAEPLQQLAGQDQVLSVLGLGLQLSGLEPREAPGAQPRAGGHPPQPGLAPGAEALHHLRPEAGEASPDICDLLI